MQFMEGFVSSLSIIGDFEYFRISSEHRPLKTLIWRVRPHLFHYLKTRKMHMYCTCIENMKYITRVSHFYYYFYSSLFSSPPPKKKNRVAKSDNEVHVSICIKIGHYCCPILTKAVVFQKIRVPLSHTKFHGNSFNNLRAVARAQTQGRTRAAASQRCGQT